MKTQKILSICALLVAFVTCAHATQSPTNVTVSAGVDVTAAPKSDIGDYGDTTVFNWLTADVHNYNTINSTTLPAPIPGANGQTSQTGGTGGNSFTITLNGTADYLFFHWGGQGGGWEQAFYIAGLVGVYTFNNSAIGTGGPPSVGGLSFYSLFGGTTTGNLPDGASTVMLLGASLSGLTLLARRFKK